MKERVDRKMKQTYPPLSREWTIVGRTLDKFSKPIALQLKRTNITPNQVTILRFLIFIPLSTFFFSRGSWVNIIIGSALANLFNFFDYVDGDLARFKNMYSNFGDRLEHVLDKVGLFLIFFGVVYGTFNYTKETATWMVGFIGLIALSLTMFFDVELDPDNNPSRLLSMLENTPKLNQRIRSVVLLDKQILKVFFLPLYLITIGALFNKLFIVLWIFAITGNVRCICMFYVFYRLVRTKED